MMEALITFAQVTRGVASSGPGSSGPAASPGMPWALILIAVGVVTWLMFRKGGSPRGSISSGGEKDIDV